MKKYVLFLAAAGMIASCNRLAENEFEIEGKIDKSLDGKNVILEKQGGYMGFVPVDTAKVENGKFVFKGTVTDPELHFVNIEGMQGKVELILEHGEIELDVDKDSIFKTKQGGTFNNEKLNEYYTDINKIRKKMIDFQKKNQDAMMKAYKANDTVAMSKLNKVYSEISKEMQDNAYKFVEKNPKAYITVLLIKQMAGMQSKPMSEIKKYYDALDADLKKTKEGKELGEMIKNNGMPPAVPQTPEGDAAATPGKQAAGFSAPNPDGKTVSLKESLGKVTIIDFWASWCPPCRKENPAVVAMYKELHPKGLNIIGVSLDDNKDSWKKAIAADGLTWTHVSNLKKWNDPIAKLYGVESVPATFVLDAEGNIVARDLRGAELKAKVKELLK
ncbi:MAG: redoxin domain-containing protein [Flavobacterium sp.]